MFVLQFQILEVYMLMSKKFIASAICVSMLASLGGCALFDNDNEGVLKAAEDYASAVSKVKTADIAALTGGEAGTIADYINGGSDTASSYNDIVSAIAGTITYEINEGSVTSSKKNAEGSVDITWTLVDYDAVYDQVSEDGGDAEDFVEALEAEDAQTMSISQTLNLVLQDETWFISDADYENLFDVYEFYPHARDFLFESPLAQYIAEDYWYFSDDGVYTNEYCIELDLITTDEGETVEFNFTYEYYRDGELIYTSNACSDTGHWIEAYYSADYDPDASVNEIGNLIPGEYRCIIYDMNGIVLADSTCTVEAFDYPDADASMIEQIEWYWTDHDDVYVDENGIELDIIPTTEGQNAIWHFYYEVYLNGELVYTSDEFEDQGYWIEAYYSQWYDQQAQVTTQGYLVPGEYTIIMYDMDGGVLAESSCTVELS